MKGSEEGRGVKGSEEGRGVKESEREGRGGK